MSNIFNKKRKISKFLTCRNVILASLTTTIAAVPLAVGLTQIANDFNNYTFDGKKFSSVDSAVDYVKNKSVQTNVEGTNSKWSITKNGKTTLFNSPEDLREYVYKYITEESYISNVDVNSAQYKEANNMLTEDRNFWDHTYKKDATEFEAQKDTLTKTIYQARNNRSTTDLNDAINSYFESHDAYYFNNIYFESANDLKSYLTSQYFPNNNVKANTIVLQGPNGVKSNPINILNATDAAEQINNFINNNANRVFNYKNTTTGETITLNKNDLSNSAKIAAVNSKDLNYTHMHSNQGTSRYVIDNFDDANLIGPYFYNGVLDIGSFQNKSMWKKVNKVDKQVYVESKVDSMIGSFFSSIINDDNALNINESQANKKDAPLFRTGLLFSSNETKEEKNGEQTTTEELSLDDWFIQALNSFSPQLKNEVVEVNTNLMSGNKYNTFYKIPVMYSYLMQRIASWGLSQWVSNLVIYYFSQVCNYIQDAIEIVVLDDSLLIGKNGKKFNTREFFQIGNSEYDLNTSVEYFLNEIKTQYPQLIVAMDSYIGSFNNLFLTSGLMPFSSYDQSYLFEFGVIEQSDYYKIYDKLTNIFTTFSQTDYSNMLGSFVPNSTNPDVQAVAKLPSSEWEEKLDATASKYSNSSIGIILKAIGMKNTQQHNLARSILNSELRIYWESGYIVTDGYLSLLYSKDASQNRLDKFTKFIFENENVDTYKVYLAFLIDVRMNANVISQDSLRDTNAFAQSLTRIIGMTLGTSYLVGTTINNLYKSSTHAGNPILFHSSNNTMMSSKSIPSPQQHPIWDSLEQGSISSKKSSLRVSSQLKTIGVNNGRGVWDDLTNYPNPPLSETNWDLYSMPSNFQKVSNTPGGNRINLTEELNKHFSWLSDFGIDIEATTFYNKKPIPVKVTGTITQSQQIQNIVSAFKNSQQVEVNVYGQTMGLTVRNGVDKKDKKSIKLLFPADEVDAIVSNTFKSPSVSVSRSNSSMSSYIDSLFEPIYSSVKNLDLPGGPLPTPPITPTTPTPSPSPSPSPSPNPSPSPSPSLPDVDVNSTKTTTFSSNFRKKIGGANLLSKAKSAWQTTKQVVSVVKNIMTPILAFGFTALETYFFIFDLLSVTNIKDYYVYTTADGTEFIWDGGLTVSKFMGFYQQRVVGIESMKLMTPVQITLPQIEEYYYYNGIKYYDISELKKNQLTDMMNNNYVGTNENFKAQYTLSDLSNASVKSYDTITDLTAAVLKDMGITVNNNEYNFDSLNTQSEYLSNASYAYANGVIANNNDYVTMAEQVVKNLRTTNIAMLPQLDASNKTTGVMKDFVLPGKYWDNKTSTVKTNNDNTLKYIIDNSANQLKDNSTSDNDFLIADASKAQEESLKLLKESFVKELSTKMSSKKVLTTEFNINNEYSKTNGDWKFVNLYRVNINNLGFKYFTSREDATNYVLKALSFKKDTDLSRKVYTFNGMYIGDEEQVYNWVTGILNSSKRE